MKIKNTKEIKDLNVIKKLIAGYYHMHNITDETRIENFIKKNNERLLTNEIRCFIYEDEKPEGFLICYYYLDKKYIFFEDFYFLENIEKKSNKILEFLISASEIVKDEKSYLFRVYIEEIDTEPELLNLLRQKGFDVYRRENMAYEVGEELASPELPAGYSFVDYDKSRSKENRAVDYDSYVNDTDGIIYPEGFEPKEEEVFEMDNPELSPHVEYKGKYVGICCVEKISDTEALIHGVSVKKDFQGKGLGKLIMKEILYRAKQNNVKKAILTVSMDNTRAATLYQKLGFKSYRVFHVVNRIYRN